MKPGAELGVVRQRRQPLRGLGRERRRRVVQQVRVGALAAAPDAPADLVELGQAERVGVLDDQRVRLRDVDPRLDDRRAHEHVRAAAQVVHHHLLELALGHLAVGDREAHARAQRPQPLGRLVDRLDAVVQEERLPVALVLAQDRALDELLLVLAHVRLHRPAALRRRLDHRDVAQPRQRHLQRARDRRGRHRDHVHLQLQLAQQLLLLDPEALLLVDDQQAEILRADVAREHAVGADQDVHAPLGEALDRRFLLGRRAKARDVLERERVVGQALGERAVVLLGEDRRRHQHQHLLAVVRRLEGRAQRHLGLAVADVAADQPVHRPRRFHVGLDQLDRLALVGRLGEREALLELALPVGVRLERVPAPPPALGVQAQQLARQLLRGAPRARLHRVPARAAELAQRRIARRPAPT